MFNFFKIKKNVYIYIYINYLIIGEYGLIQMLNKIR